MLNKLFDRFFWFIQPSSVLSHADNVFGYISIGLLAVAIALRVLVGFTKNPIDKKVLLKTWHLGFTIGIFGLIWFGLRFENTPIFAERYWFGLIVIIGIVWALFILKYLGLEYMKEKQEYSREVIKSKYLPKAR